jgi:predicted DNA-binding transcriptional regulator AlpA
MFTYDQLLRRRQVYEITGMSRYMVDLLEGAGEFPKRLSIGPRAVFWSAAEIAEYIEQKKAARDLGIALEARS